MEEHSMLSPEKVHLNLNLAGLGSRFVALFLDAIFQAVLLFFFFAGIFLLFLIISPTEVDLHSFEFAPTIFWIVIILLLLFFILNGYFIVFEAVFNGQTPGKMLIKLRVVQENGSSLTFLMVLIRNIFRIIDSIPLFYSVGIITVLISKKNQRLGDMVAGTLVIREHVENAPTAVNFEVIETPWSGKARLHIHEIGENEFAVLKEYLLRRETLQQEEAKLMEQKLVLFFSQKLGLQPEETGEPSEFLQQVAALYQHQSGPAAEAVDLRKP